MSTDLFRRPLRAIASGEATAPAFAVSQLARIDATDDAIEAWAHLDAAHVREEAQRCDSQHARGALAGCGIGVKDIIATSELPTQIGSPVYAGHRPEQDAQCVARIKQAGGFVFGKTVTTEFAFMHAGKTKNPWNREHTPGGSSSGSAAAVAAGHVAAAIGTQTNGSVVRPAAYCGVVGFKPTTGAIPYAGINVFSATLDAVGTFTRNVADAALLASARLPRGISVDAARLRHRRRAGSGAHHAAPARRRRCCSRVAARVAHGPYDASHDHALRGRASARPTAAARARATVGEAQRRARRRRCDFAQIG